MELPRVLQIINDCLTQIYSETPSLFELIQNKSRCERCLVFRFAHYLQNKFQNAYFVDCDYNSSIINGQRQARKQIPDEEGNMLSRFVDIIVHKRNDDFNTDFICFEFKKWDNHKDRRKDENNLIVLTTQYNYKFGFYIIFGKTKEETKIFVFENGQLIQTN